MQQLKLDDFLNYNFLSAVKLAPSGKAAAYLVSSAEWEQNDYLTDLYLVDGDNRLRLTQSGHVKAFVWNDDETLFYTEQRKTDKTAPFGCTELFRLHIGGEAELVMTVDGAAVLEGILQSGVFVFSRVDNLRHQQALQGLDGEEYASRAAELKAEDSIVTVFDEYPFWFNSRGIINKTRKAIYLCDTLKKNFVRVTPELFRVELMAVEGSRIIYSGSAFETVEAPKAGAYIYDVSTEKTTCVHPEGISRIHSVALWGGRAVVASSKADVHGLSQCPDIDLIDSDNGKAKRLCTYEAELTINNPVGSDCRYGGGTLVKAAGGWLYFIRAMEETSQLWRMNSDGYAEPVYEGDGSVDCFDVRSGSICMVAMQGMRLQELYWMKEEGLAVRVTSWNDDLFLSVPPVMPESLNFQNADGDSIHGFVLKPVGYDPAKRYPAILDIHGGPYTSYGAVYYHEMQYWAGQGYFVLFCNPRGSAGRGNAFGNISGKFGTIDYDDIMAFCDHVLEAYPAIDPARVGVTGGSYGGYMTNWIIGHTDRFAAAASQRSISNFVTMEGTSDIGATFTAGQVLASTHTDVKTMWEHSPLRCAGYCKTPTLFIHSEQDYRCWMVEALQMYTTLIHNGVPTKLCLFHGENHELSRSGHPKSRVRRLQEITAWMDRFLKQKEEV